MAKGKSKKPGKARKIETAVTAEAPKTVAIPRGVRKHLKQLEGQLEGAARKEHKRLQQLERARQRRQLTELALDKLRGPASQPAPADSKKPAD